MVILKSRKHVFWEALLITVVVFVLGFLLGIAYEAGSAQKINRFYTESEIDLNDIFVMNNLIDFEGFDCGALVNSNIEFADKIYKEAREIERLEATGRITELTKIAHHRYDLLRTFLWVNSIKTLENCPNEDFSIVVYLYELETEELVQKATQNVWSRILSDLKQKKGNTIILIPIAADAGFVSLDLLTANFNITKYPVVIIDNKEVITELRSVEELETYFK